METTSAAGSARRGLAGLILVSAAALTGMHETTASPQSAPGHAALLESSRDLIALHRLADPSPFRCNLCRLAPALNGPAAVRIGNPQNCDAVPGNMSQL